MKIARGASVRIEYQLKVKNGEVIESSAKSGPLRYVHGEGKMLPGLEQRLEGLSPGDERQGEIPAREAFGTEDSLPVKQMRPSEFPTDIKPTVGLVFEAKTGRGDVVSFKVVSVTKDVVSVRLLHPLVGRDIEYQVKVLSVNDPNASRAAGAPPLPPGVVELDLDEVKES
jgi:FKBP-type peptidyl-prolyl cis-trans isomerase SlyD